MDYKRVFAYLYKEGLDSEGFQGYKQGVFYALDFDVDEMFAYFESQGQQVKEDVAALVEEGFIALQDGRILFTEIGFAHYINDYLSKE